jgi:hypothetical protein
MFPQQNSVVISYCQGLIAICHHVTNYAAEVLQVYTGFQIVVFGCIHEFQSVWIREINLRFPDHISYGKCSNWIQTHFNTRQFKLRPFLLFFSVTCFESFNFFLCFVLELRLFRQVKVIVASCGAFSSPHIRIKFWCCLQRQDVRGCCGICSTILVKVLSVHSIYNEDFDDLVSRWRAIVCTREYLAKLTYTWLN